MVRIGRIVAQQFGQHGSPGLVHGGSQSGLDRLQIAAAVVGGAPEKPSAATDLLRGQLLVGWPAPVFFLGRLLGQFHGPQAADFSIDIDQLAGQGLELTELSDLSSALRTAAGEGRF